MKRQGIKKGIYVLPNLFTTANLFCGFFAMVRAINGDFVTAAWMVLLAGVFDFLDGRVARFTKSESEFGLEYDSLVDLASFGLAPAILMYTWNLHHFSRIGWAAAFLFFACGALRLARFNVQAGDVEKKHFQGLPIPAAAYCLAGYVILRNHLSGPDTSESYFLIGMNFLLALLMVSNVPYQSFKVLDRNQRAHFFFLVVLVGALFVVAAAPQVMIFVFSTLYVASGILGEIFRSPKRMAGLSDFLKRLFHPPEEIRGPASRRKSALLSFPPRGMTGGGKPNLDPRSHSAINAGMTSRESRRPSEEGSGFASPDPGGSLHRERSEREGI